MERVSARTRQTLLGILFLALGVGIAVYIWAMAGAFDAVGAALLRIPFDRSSPVARGAQVYGASCASCHGGAIGGSARDYPPKHNANGHSWQHADCELEAAIRTGVGLSHTVETRPASPPAALAMPAWGERLSDQQIGDVIAFIKTMWSPDQRVSQEALTRERCAA